MNPVIPVAAYAVAFLAAWLIYRIVSRTTILWAAGHNRCFTCILLGQIPHRPQSGPYLGAPPYWLLRMHLRNANRALDREEETVPGSM